MANITIDQEKEQLEIQRALRGLIRACTNTTTKTERREITRAFKYAQEAHHGARRKSGEAYIFHPLAVARIVVKEIGLDATSVMCALLHDVVEDTFAELDDIKREFGSEVCKIIDGLTKISGVFDHKSSAQAENFRKMLLTLSDDLRVILIKLADRLHNMRTLEHMKPEGQLKIASETLYLYAPLANRLGLHNIKTELEDLSLKYTEPTIFAQLNAQLQQNIRESKHYIRRFIHSIRNALKATGLKFEIKSRYKSIHSIYSKMTRQGISLEEVYDLFAIRIILDSHREDEKTDCWKVYSVVTDLYKPNPDRLRDWITIPKSNGYEALHVTVMGPRGKWIEVQIRTERMDEIAERGMAAHWRYKDDEGSTQEFRINTWLDRVREVLENPNMNAIEIVSEFKSNLLMDEVFVFTPRGDLKQLPHGSSVLDFAYEIHTNLGNNCIGAKVNNKVVPLSYQLKMGDQVEIITSKKQTPKEEWLNYTKTSKATHRIKDALRKQRRIVEQKGKEVFEWRAQKYGLKDPQSVIHEICTFFDMEDRNQFYYQLGLHKIDIKRLLEFIDIKKKGGKIEVDSQEVTPPKKPLSKKEFQEWLRDNRGINLDQLMIGEDMDISDYKIASCCQPIHGDDILGFYVPEEGTIKIHRTNCKKAISLMSSFGKNIIKAKWTKSSTVTFLAGIKIIGEDRQGIMNELVKVISVKSKLNMRSITIDSDDGMCEGQFKVFVQGNEQLQGVVDALSKVRGVFSVTRMVLQEQETKPVP